MKYHRLNLGEREEISRRIASGVSLQEIARNLHRSSSTISREVQRIAQQEDYRACAAHKQAVQKQQLKRLGYQKIEKNPFLKKCILEKLILRWSPQQIAHGLKRQYPTDMTMRISHETIYTYLYVLSRGTLKKELLSYLRQKHKQRHHKGGRLQDTQPKIKNMISIDERPQEVAERIIPGHWEGDIILGKERKSQLGTLVERTTRFLLLVPLKDKKAPTVRRAFAKEAKKIPGYLRKSLTYDQGYEMVEHTLFTKGTKMQVYFAHPSSPWERGTNENTNGLIRQFFPKGSDFSQVTTKEIRHVQGLLNGRPRKVLAWKNPAEVFNQLLH